MTCGRPRHLDDPNAASTTSKIVVNIRRCLATQRHRIIRAGTNLLGSAEQSAGAADIRAPTTSACCSLAQPRIHLLQGAAVSRQRRLCGLGPTATTRCGATARQRPLVYPAPVAVAARRAPGCGHCRCHPQLPGAPAGHQHRGWERADIRPTPASGILGRTTSR